MQHAARPLRSTRRLANLQGALPGWYAVRNQADGPALVSIYDEIGLLGTSAQSFMDELRSLKGDIELHLNSPGGDVFDGIAIFNTLRQAAQRGTVRVVVDGLAASAASFIAQAASPGCLEMAPHSQMMIHDGFGMAIGNAADMREMAALLDKASDNIAGIYAERAGKSAAHWRQKMRTETWLSDAEAVAEGLADRISGQDASGTGDWDLSVYARADGKPRARLGQVYVPEAYSRGWGESVQCPHCRLFNAPDASFCDQCGWKLVGKTDVAEVDPSTGQLNKAKGKKGKRKKTGADPDGDGDDDTSAKGDTDHDYVEPDGEPGPKGKPPVPPKPKPKGRAALPIRAAKPEVDRSKWDGPAAMSAASKSDDPAAAFRAICAGRRSGPEDEEKSWALPYRKTPSSPPNADGVRDALSRLPQTEGLTNEPEARAKLEGLMKEVNPDYKPGDKIDPALLQAALAIGLEGAR